MNRPTRLNVGGRIFITTADTVAQCTRLAEAVQGGDEIFLDRDPDVFACALKVLRGYPAAQTQAVQDEDVLHELSFWKHSFSQAELPKWMQQSETRFSDIEPSIHTLDPVQSTQYGRTHVLVIANVVDILVKMGALPLQGDVNEAYPLCRVVGAEAEWNDCRWVRTALLRRAEMRVRYTIGVLEKK